MTKCDWLLTVFLSAVLALRLASAGSAVPAPRLARQLDTAAKERAELRARHNSALLTLFRETGIPLGSDQHSVELRASALDLINAAITNRVELADGGGVTADAVAAAAGDYVGKYVSSNAPSATNMAERLKEAVRRAEK